MEIEGLWDLTYHLFISPGHSGPMSQSLIVSQSSVKKSPQLTLRAHFPLDMAI